jgi:hypothetical protein
LLHGGAGPDEAKHNGFIGSYFILR